MKKIILTLFFLSFLTSALLGQEAESSVIVYYFHGNYRCQTCLKLEQYSKESVEKNFKDEIASGKVKFVIVNIEEPGNEHFIEDYKLYTKSLIISLVQNGDEVTYKNLTEIWQLVGDKEKFLDYVKEEIEELLGEST